MFNIEKRKLRKLIDELAEKRGRHTELVSVYVPAGYNLNEVTNQIKQEQGTAVNIKSKTTRKNVLSALEKVAQRLKLYKQTPEKGLVILCGNVSEKEGQQDTQIWEITPLEPIKTRIYRCDQTFVLDPLKDQVREKEIYGLIAIDTREASVAFLKGKSVSLFKHMKSMVPGKEAAGGQSAARYSRVRQGLLLTFLKQVGEVATKAFEQEKDLKGIILGGPGLIKDEFFKGEFLSQAMKKKVIGVKDLGYSGDVGLKELVDRSEDLLKESALMFEKALISRFLENLQKDNGLSIYGVIEVEKALEMGAVDVLIVSEDFEMKHYAIECPKCGSKIEKILKPDKLPKTCPKCNEELKIEEKDLHKELEKLAEQTDADFQLVSSDTPEGNQFLELGGIGAILRFKID